MLKLSVVLDKFMSYYISMCKDKLNLIAIPVLQVDKEVKETDYGPAQLAEAGSMLHPHSNCI